MLHSNYKAQYSANGGVRLFAYGTDTTQHLELAQVREVVPSIFAPDKHSSRSERYTFIPTGDILAGLMSEGFLPTEVRQGGSRIEGKAQFTKHMIRLRHRDYAPNVVGVSDTLYPEIVLSNSHDGTGAYVMDAGAYRVLCKNAMVASSSFYQVKLPHKGDILHNVIEGAFKVVKELPRIIDTAREWKALGLSHGEQLAFAKAAAHLRWEPEEVNGRVQETAPIEPAALLNVRRREDRGDDLWLTFNRTQEALLTGGNTYVQRDAEGRRKARRTVRPVNGVSDNRQMNQALWTLAEEMKKLKA